MECSGKEGEGRRPQDIMSLARLISCTESCMKGTKTSLSRSCTDPQHTQLPPSPTLLNPSITLNSLEEGDSYGDPGHSTFSGAPRVRFTIMELCKDQMLLHRMCRPSRKRSVLPDQSTVIYQEQVRHLSRQFIGSPLDCMRGAYRGKGPDGASGHALQLTCMMSYSYSTHLEPKFGV